MPRRTRILVVDDDEQVLRALRRLFSQALDADVVTAQGATKALEELEGSPADIVLSDHLMPGVDGVTLLGVVRDRWPGTWRVLAAALPASDTVMEAVNRAGVYRILPKTDPTALRRLMTDLVAERQQVGARVPAPREGPVVILIVDDDPQRAAALKLALDDELVELISAENAFVGLELLEARRVDIVVAEARVKGLSAVGLLETVCLRWPDTLRVLSCGQPDERAFVEAVNRAHVQRILIQPAGDLRESIEELVNECLSRRGSAQP